MRLIHGELFAGISGFGLGFSNAGIKTLWHVEIDARCQEVLRYHYPDTLLLADVRDCGKHNLPYADIISFGTPCQDLSVAGKRKGLKGERSGLFFEAIRIVDELKPAFAVWENVPGAFSSSSGRDFAAVLSAFQECGARDIAWRVLDAQYFGVAQRRRRIFLVTDFRGERAAEVLFERESSPWDSPPSRETGKGIAAPIKASSPGRRGGGSWPIAEEFVVLPFDTTQITSPQNRSNPQPGDICHPLTGSAHAPAIVQHALSGHNQRYDPDGEHFVICNALDTHSGGPDDNDAQGNRLVYIRNMNDFGVNISPTLRTPQGSGSEMLYGVRRLTPTECERLQGFPDGWTAVNGMKDAARYKMLGNAVCVPVAEWLGRRLLWRGDRRQEDCNVQTPESCFSKQSQ